MRFNRVNAKDVQPKEELNLEALINDELENTNEEASLMNALMLDEDVQLDVVYEEVDESINDDLTKPSEYKMKTNSDGVGIVECKHVEMILASDMTNEEYYRKLKEIEEKKKMNLKERLMNINKENNELLESIEKTLIQKASNNNVTETLLELPKHQRELVKSYLESNELQVEITEKGLLVNWA